MKKKRFEVIQNIPSPYRLHLFKEMWRQLASVGVDFHVNFMSEGHSQRPDSWRNPQIDFPHQYWRDYGVRTHHFNPGLIAYIRKCAPDYLLVGSPFDTFTSIITSWMCPANMRCAWVEGQTKTPGQMNGFKGAFKRIVLSKYPLVGVPGSDGARYFAMHQALTRRRMPRPIMLPNLIDETRFRVRSDWSTDDIDKMRDYCGVDEAYTKLCIIPARLDAVKGLVEFVEKLSPQMIKGWKIVIMGQGPLKDEIIAKATDIGIVDNLRIFDYVPYLEMPKFYAAADLFLLPSKHDPNPLSVVEALHSGLPIALSDRAGNIEEAVSERCNGWRLPVLNSDLYRTVLEEVFATPIEALRKMGRHSKEDNARFWDSKKSVANFLKELIGVSIS